MARAQGALAQMALAYETVYGTPPVSGFRLMPLAERQITELDAEIASERSRSFRPRQIFAADIGPHRLLK